MKIIPIINRIKAECATLSNRVEAAQSLEALPDSDVINNLPMAFVYSSDEDTPGHETLDNNYITNQRFSVISVCRNVDMDTEDEPLETLRDEQKAALVGYQPTANHNPINWASGKIIATSKRMVWWVDTYETFTYT